MSTRGSPAPARWPTCYLPIRAGADIAFVGGLINYVLSSGKYFKDYVLAYTNAATILTEDYADTEDLDGVFSGLNREHRYYDFDTWRYQGQGVEKPAGGEHLDPDAQRRIQGQSRRAGRGEAHGCGGAAAHPTPDTDDTLQHPRCVFQVLKRHFARYTPEMVEQVCGVPRDLFAQVCELVTDNSGRDRTTAFVYSLGWTQHTVGVQYIRTAAILQALLGNMGRPGGGILALRGHASIQGSTDIPTLFDLLPGYLPMPFAYGNEDLDAYVQAESVPRGFWANTREYLVSLLKAWWGDAATAENDFCYDYLPRLTGSHSTYETVLAQLDGTCTGYFLFGQNPAVGSANARMQRLGMAKLDWLVVRDMVMIESATWWKDGPEIETGETAPRGHRDRGLLPARRRAHREGRQLHQHPAAAAVAPSGRRAGRRRPQRPVVHLPPRTPDPGQAGRLRRRGGPAGARPDLGLPDDGQPGRSGRRRGARRDQRPGPGRAAAVVVHPADRRRLHGVRLLDLLRRPGRRRQPGRPPHAGAAAELGGAGLGLGLAGEPARALQPGVGRPRRQAVERAQGPGLVGRGAAAVDRARRAGLHRRPSALLPAAAGATGVDAISGADPFIMQADGKAWLFAPAGLIDGPLPAHYEPQESPFRNLFYGQQHNPVRQIIRHRENRYQPSGDQPGSEVFPYVTTTYRLTEHHTAGGMSRFLPYLSELQPAFFCEVSPQLAAERGLEHLGWATIITARNAIEARVLVTERIRPLSGAGPDAAPGGAALALGTERLHDRRRRQRTGAPRAGPERAHPGGQGHGVRHPPRAAPPGSRLARPRADLPAAGRHHRPDRNGDVRWTSNRLT